MTVIDMTVIEYPWDKPPARLTADEAHVWHAELDLWVEWVPWLTQILFPDERAKTERFCFPKDRQHFIVCRGLPLPDIEQLAKRFFSQREFAVIDSPTAGGCSWSRSHAPH